MKCPFCSNLDSRVVKSCWGDKASNTIKRRRQCLNCLKRFTTFEILAKSLEDPSPLNMFNTLKRVDKNLEEMQKKMNEISKFL